MTPDELLAIFGDDDAYGEHLKFDRVNPKRSNRPDLHAFLPVMDIWAGKTATVSAWFESRKQAGEFPRSLVEKLTGELVGRIGG